MALSAGDRLGSYEILGLLGAGGMGEVHRAADTNRSNDYGVTADGQRFLVKVPAGEPVEPRIHVATHWPSLLE